MSSADYQKTIVDLAKGNPGAAEVLGRVFETRGQSDFSSVVHGLRVMGFSGPQIWLCYEHFAGGDLGRFVEAVRERNQDMQELVHRRSR